MTRRPRTPADVVRELLTDPIASGIRAAQGELTTPLGWVEEVPESARPRRRGRGSRWTAERFDRHWQEAVARADGQTLAQIASAFDALDGTRGGLSADQLGRLRRKRRRGDLPDESDGTG